MLVPLVRVVPIIALISFVIVADRRWAIALGCRAFVMGFDRVLMVVGVAHRRRRQRRAFPHLQGQDGHNRNFHSPCYD